MSRNLLPVVDGWPTATESHPATIYYVPLDGYRGHKDYTIQTIKCVGYRRIEGVLYARVTRHMHGQHTWRVKEVGHTLAPTFEEAKSHALAYANARIQHLHEQLTYAEQHRTHVEALTHALHEA